MNDTRWSYQLHPEASTGAEFNESLSVGCDEQLLAVGDMQLTKDRCEVMADRRFGNAQPIRDLHICKTLRKRLYDLSFSRGQALNKPHLHLLIASGRRPIAGRASGGLRRWRVHGSWNGAAQGFNDGNQYGSRLNGEHDFFGACR